MFNYKYLSREHLEGFDNYKYMAIDTSPLSVYVMHPFWNKVVELVPRWVAPNVLTFVGFLLTVLDFLLLSYYDYSYEAASALNATSVEAPLNGHTEVIPRSLWILLAVFLFLAYTLVESSGAWCAEAKGFVRELGWRLKKNGADPRAESFLVQRISLTIQRGNAASVMGTFAPGTSQKQFDGIDGKQARRTQTSGPLGELFDHGLDSYSVFFIPACLYSIFGKLDFSIPPIRMYYVMWNILLNFYLSHWEKYNTGVLFLPWGYDFSMWTSTFIFLWTGFKGTGWYKRYLFGGYTLADAFEWAIYGTGVFTTLPVSIYNIYKSYKLRTGKMRSFTEALRPLWSLAQVFAVCSVWVHYSRYLQSDPRALFLLVGTVFSNVACRLIVSQMSNRRCDVINWLFYPLALCCALSLACPQHEPALFYGVTALSVVAHVHYGASVVNQMCDHFRINCFHIKQRSD